MIKRLMKAAAAVMLCAAFSLKTMAAVPASVSLIRYDGTTISVESSTDPVFEMILQNIEKELGEEGLKAYLDAVKTGDYTGFYTVQGNTVPTYKNPAYMTNRAGIDLSALHGGNPLTYAQRIERCCKLSAGETATIPFSRVRTLAMEAGFSGTNQEAYRDIRNITGIDAYATGRAAGKFALPDNIHIFTDNDIKDLKGEK